MSTDHKKPAPPAFQSLRSLWNKRISRLMHRLVSWFFFSVIMTLLPLILGSLVSYVRGEPITNYYDNLIFRGDLFLISTAIGGTAVGQVYSIKQFKSLVKLIVFILSFALVITSVFLYGVVSNLSPQEGGGNFANIERISLVIFWTTLMVSTGGIIIAEMKNGS
jgi:hypothetical protein